MLKGILKKCFYFYLDFSSVEYYDTSILKVEEKAWFINDDNNFLGLIGFEGIDKTYFFNIYKRNSENNFYLYDCVINIDSFAVAEFELEKKINEISKDKVEMKNESLDLFEKKFDEKKLHPSFLSLRDSKAYSSAKEIIKEIQLHYTDNDGNFIEQFQTNGFDQRMWELYLFCLFIENDFKINKLYYAPDFFLSLNNYEFSVEAVTVSNTSNLKVKTLEGASVDMEKEKTDMALRFGSSIYAKVKHIDKKYNAHYWELPHTKNKPFIIALADFHDEMSMVWSSNFLLEYLYGHEYIPNYLEGELEILPKKINPYIKENGTKIKSGFFTNLENNFISAILSTAQGTISKFNRMGKQIGFGDKSVSIIRTSMFYNKEKDAISPKGKVSSVNESSVELWSEGVSIYHNPNALFPLNPNLFPFAAHHFFGKDNQIYSTIPDNFSFNSITSNIIQE